MCSVYADAGGMSTLKAENITGIGADDVRADQHGRAREAVERYAAHEKDARPA